MPQINDDELYPLTQIGAGSTWLGSLADGSSVQFSFDGLVTAIKAETDVLHFGNATKVGQTVVGNIPGRPTTDAPLINNGGKFMGTINTFPPTEDSHIDFIWKTL